MTLKRRHYSNNWSRVLQQRVANVENHRVLEIDLEITIFRKRSTTRFRGAIKNEKQNWTRPTAAAAIGIDKNRLLNHGSSDRGIFAAASGFQNPGIAVCSNDMVTFKNHRRPPRRRLYPHPGAHAGVLSAPNSQLSTLGLFEINKYWSSVFFRWCQRVYSCCIVGTGGLKMMSKQ